MIYNAQDFSDFERCGLIPQLAKKWEPERWPVREAVKRAFVAGLLGDPEEVADNFLLEAAGRGFSYPDSEPYELAKDYASWLDGALRLVQEDTTERSPIPPFKLGFDEFHVDGFIAHGRYHVARAVTDLEQHRLRWPELILLGLGQADSVIVYQFKLPAIRKRRLISPLSIAYQQPMTGGLRLARIDVENKGFSHSWKRVGRWELPEVSWQDWRDGIDRDRCMNQIQENYEVPAMLTGDRKRLAQDIEGFAISMRSQVQPRKWEACENCIFKSACHGHKEGLIRKTVQRASVQREDEALVVLP